MRSTTASRSLIACSIRPSRRTRLSRAPASSASTMRIALSASASLVSPTASWSAASWRLTSALSISSPSANCLASISAGLASSSAKVAGDLLAPRIELDDLAVGVGQALAPARVILRDAAQPLDPHLGFARQAIAVRLRPRPARRAARRYGRAACRPSRGRPGCRQSTDSRAWRKVRRISASATSPTISAIVRSVPAWRVRSWSVRRDTSACRSRAWVAARSAGAMALCAPRSAARVASPASCALRRDASATCRSLRRALLDAELLGLARRGQPALLVVDLGLCLGLLGHDAVDLLADIGQPVALAEAHRRGRRRAGAHRVAVPAPHRALDGDELLAGLEARLQRGTRRVVGDDADEADAALELGQRLHVGAERRRAFRQGRRIGQQAERQPMGRRTAIRRGFEILAERRAERLLEARRDGHRIEQRRPQRTGRRLQRRGDACLLGPQLGEPRIGLLQQLVGGGDSSPRQRPARRRAPAPSRCARLRPGRRPGARHPIRSARPRAPARSTPRPDGGLLPRPGAPLRARPRPPAAPAGSTARSRSGAAGPRLPRGASPAGAGAPALRRSRG